MNFGEPGMDKKERLNERAPCPHWKKNNKICCDDDGV